MNKSTWIVKASHAIGRKQDQYFTQRADGTGFVGWFDCTEDAQKVADHLNAVHG